MHRQGPPPRTLALAQLIELVEEVSRKPSVAGR
jgi:hypothetical protein